jgi:60 kDa SS-A/Ro ribonucleoprotein
LCEEVQVFAFHNTVEVIPPRRGFALRDAIGKPRGGTHLGAAVTAVNMQVPYDRLIVITDEQSADRVPAPKAKGYVINVASNKNGVGYGPWTHIDGWSEAVIDYLQEFENIR